MMVSEAHRLGKKVAAHAMGWDGIDAALRASANEINGHALAAKIAPNRSNSANKC